MRERESKYVCCLLVDEVTPLRVPLMLVQRFLLPQLLVELDKPQPRFGTSSCCTTCSRWNFTLDDECLCILWSRRQSE